LTLPLARTLRAVAIYEAAKGILVLLTGFGLLVVFRHHIQQIAEQIVSQLHLNPAGHLPRIFLDVAASMTDARLWMFATFAAGYAILRIVMAYGLWFERRWAEWLAALSAAIYLPFEVHELYTAFSWFVIIAMIVNVLIIALMVTALHRSRPAGAGQND
jgi:uncharacterized membrane protein (DUF2068 family)